MTLLGIQTPAFCVFDLLQNSTHVFNLPAFESDINN